MTSRVLRKTEDFEEFYERHWKYVYRLCFTYMGNEADAENCTEDVFVKVLTSPPSFCDAAHERKWLTVTAANLCKDRLRSRAVRAYEPLEGSEGIPAEEAEDYSDLRQAVLALPVKYRELIFLYYYDGYDTGEIADMLARPPSTVRNQLRDAREALKKFLEDENYE